MPTALIIPPDGPIAELDQLDGGLDQLQQLVGGNIQALPLPAAIDPHSQATCYVNEDGKFDPDCPPNMRATDFMIPGVGLFWGDYVAGTFILAGFNPQTGEHPELPPAIRNRALKIAAEAA